MANDFKLKVGLDIPQSSEQILKDLMTLQKQLPSLDVKLSVGKQAISDIKTQFSTLKLPKIPVGVEIDPESLKAITKKITKELNLDITPKTTKKTSSNRTTTNSATKSTQDATKEAQKLHKEFQKVGSTATNAINGMTESLRKLSAEESNAAGQLGKLAKQFQDVSHLLNKDVWDENETKQVQDFLKTFKEVSAEVKNQKRESGAAFFDEAQISKVYASLNKVRELVAQYPKILSDPRFKTWYESFNNINFDDLKTGKIDIEKLTREMSNFTSEAKQAGLATQTLGQRFQTIAKNAALGNIAQTLLSEIKQLGREAYENVKELDKAMVELKKVTDETSATYSKFFENAKTQAKEVGSSLSDAITATADFARLGYSIGEAADLAKASQIYYNVGDGFNSITEASESVISTMKAFGIETKDVMRIVDAFNTTGNNFAISTQGVGEAMKRSASALAAAGNDMYESIALITAANSVVQDPASVGTALKTLSLRIRGATADLEQAGLETEGMAISTAKLREEVLALTDMKVDIMLNDEEFKSTYQIMEEISRVWKDIADVDQAALLELLGGKRQANILSSMLANFETAQEALEKSANSAGSAMAENEKYLDSIGGKLKQLEAAWESLSATVLNSELVKGLLDFAIGFVQTIDKIISALGSIETAVGGMIADIGIRSDILQVFKDIDAGASASTATVIGLKQAVRSLGNAAIAVIAIKVIDWLHDNIATANAARESYNELSDTLSGMHTNKDEIFELGARLEELKDKTELTTAEWEEYHDIQNRLHELLPELKGYYDSQQNWILTEIDSVESLAEAYRDLEQDKRRAMADEYTGGYGVTMQEEDRRKYNSAVDRQREAQWAVDLFEKKERQGFLSFTDSWNLMMSGFETIEEALHVVTQQQSYRNTYTSDARNQLANDALAYTVVGSMSEEIQNAFIEALGQFDFNTTQDYISKISKGDYSVWNDVYDSSVYQDIISGRLDDYGTARTSIIELGGLDQANALLVEYEGNQQAINDGTYQWTDRLQESHLAAIEAYRAWLETQKAGNDTLNNTKPLSLEEFQKGLIEDMNTLEESVKALGEAYSEFAEGGEITASTLASLSETFGSCGDEWTDFVSLVGSGNMTLSDLDSSLEKLITRYAEQKALTGDVTEETKQMLQTMLESIGITNAEEVASRALSQALAKQEAQRIAAANPQLMEMSAAEIEKFLIEIEASQETCQALYKLYLAKLQASDGGLLAATEKEIGALKQLAIQAGVTGEALLVYDQYLSLANQAQSLRDQIAAGSGDSGAVDELRNIEAAIADCEDKMSNPDIDTYRWEADFNKISGAAEKTADKISDAFQEAYDELQYLRDANLISEQEYLQKLYQLNEQYNKKNLATYRKYQLQIFQGIKSMLAGQINSQADSQISALESQRDATERRYDALIKAKEKEKEQKEKYYDDLIEAEQNRLDQLKEEWTVQDHLLKIEQARAALAAAQQQKTVHIYKEGEGFVWERDEEAVGAAQDDLNEAVKSYDRYNQEQEIKDRIDAIEEEKETVLEALEEEIEALEEAKDRALEAIDQQIAAVEAWREEALAALEEVGLTLEDFLKFFEMFGIEVDEGLMKLIEDFAKMAQESGINIDELTGKVKGLGTALSGLTNGEYAADLEATGGKANPETGVDDPVNVFEEFTEAVKLWKDETVTAIDEVNLRFEELLEHLDEFETKTEFLKTWQTEAITALTDLGLKLTDFLALLDQFDVRFDEDVPLWKDAILTALDEVSLKINDFLVLLDNFDTTIDEGLLSLVDSFANMAAESNYHIDLIIAKLQELSDALAALGNGEYVTGATTGDGEGATDAGSDENDAFSTTGGNLFEAIIDQFRVLNEETAKYLDLIKDKWYATINDIQLLLNNFQEDGLVMMQEAVAESILEIENQLTLFGEFLNQFSLEATEALQPLVDQFTKLFVGEVEHTSEDGSTEILSWIDYYKVMIDEIIAKHDEWWEYIIEYLEFVEEAHEWLNKVLEEQIEKVEEWKTSLIEDMDEVIQKMEELSSVAESTSSRVSESFNAMSEAVQSAASEISGACESIANAINSLPDGKTITITTVYRTVYETVGSPSVAPSNSGNRTVVERVNADGSVDSNASLSSSPSTNMSPGVGYQDGDEWIDADGTIISGKWASGTLSVPTTGMALTDEEGPEIRIPGKGTFRKLHYGDAILPADVSRNLWMIGAKPVSFAKGIANMISNKSDDNRQNVFNFGDIHLPNVQNAQDFANEFKDIVMKATQLVYSK